MVIQEFEDVYTKRLRAIEAMRGASGREWQLAYIARIVPIKGLHELLDSCRMLLDRGVTNWHLDVLGPIDATVREYHDLCVRRVSELGLEEKVTFRGVMNVREVIGEFDALRAPSFNEGQPMVVLEAMTAAVPTIGTMVGGMPQLLADRLTHTTGRSWEAGGILVDPVDIPLGVADAIQAMLADLDGYEALARNARGRVEDFFQLHDAMSRYYDLYRHLARKEAAVRALLELVEEQESGVVDPRLDAPNRPPRPDRPSTCERTGPRSSCPSRRRSAPSWRSPATSCGSTASPRPTPCSPTPTAGSTGTPRRRWVRTVATCPSTRRHWWPTDTTAGSRWSSATTGSTPIAARR